MSIFFGPIRQIGYVVNDIEAAMQHWIETCRIGPWFYIEKLPIFDFHYRGIAGSPHLSIALANSGEIQLELIEQRDNTPTMYRDFLDKGKEGLQHWSSWPENYDDIYSKALKNKFEVGQEADSPRGRFVYFYNEGHPGTVIELAHLTPERRKIFDEVRHVAANWDGEEPIRTLLPS